MQYIAMKPVNSTWVVLAILWVVCICCPGCGEHNGSVTVASPTEQPRFVLLYAPCTVNKNFLSPYNSNVGYTPHLEAFAQHATVFTKHRTEAGLSGIAYASILSGNQASEHGVFSHPTTLSDSIYDITEAFSDNGYEVFFWNDQPMGAADLNYGQGTPKGNIFLSVLTAQDPQFQAILQKLASDSRYKAFVLVNLRVNHNPYRYQNLVQFSREYPDEFKGPTAISEKEFRRYLRIYYENDYTLRYNFAQARRDQKLSDDEVSKLAQVVELLYKSNIPELDRLFGQLVTKVDAAGLAEQSLIAFTADHGESMYRAHAPFKWSHGHALQADVLDVPLIIRTPQATIASRDFVTRSVDIFPTLVSLAQLRLPSHIKMEGYDLSSALKGKQKNPGLTAFSHTGMVFPSSGDTADVQQLMGQFMARFYSRSDIDLTWVAMRQNDMVWKYRCLDSNKFAFQAFDLSRDPSEAKNVFNPGDVRHQEMALRLKEYKSSLVQGYRQWHGFRNQAERLKEQRMARLRSMSYIK